MGDIPPSATCIALLTAIALFQSVKEHMYGTSLEVDSQVSLEKSI